jgi:hypothetical protein
LSRIKNIFFSSLQSLCLFIDIAGVGDLDVHDIFGFEYSEQEKIYVKLRKHLKIIYKFHKIIIRTESPEVTHPAIIGTFETSKKLFSLLYIQIANQSAINNFLQNLKSSNKNNKRERKTSPSRNDNRLYHHDNDPVRKINTKSQ